MWETMNGQRLDDSLTGGAGDGLVVEFEDLEIF